MEGSWAEQGRPGGRAAWHCLRMDPFTDTLQRLRETFGSGRTRPAEFRAAQLKGLSRFLQENKELLQEALAQDLHKSAFESEVSEISISQNEVNLALRNLRAWMKDEKVPKNLATQLDSAFIRKEPFGLVLIIAPWNYPLNLSLEPLVGALAAGNCVVLKPSEISKSTEKVLAEVLPRYLDQSCFAVVLGGPQETGQLLEHKFDYIFFTGSPQVGKIVMAAAAKHLTPVTLELGGKNPCYVDDNCDPQTVANRVAFFRYFNCGQTCVAPDYILCSPEMQARLLPALQSAITRFYGEDPQSSPDLGRIISEKNFQRLRGLLSCGRVAIGGQSDESDRYIAPTVLVGVQETEPVMQEEIFGPILPIMNVRSLDEAIEFIRRREKPLALYTFSNSSQVVKRVLAQTSSGGFCGNDGFMHMTVASLPFGGVGASGMGSYHGKFSFDTFSHHRACLLRRPGLEKVYTLRYPPHTPRNLRVLLTAMETRSCSCTLL
ncbi:aldehyde dehydrogenase family 3 member B1 isoform X1 [Mesoplodon densirostris]|uniref:aldehyde dehydrogenase family 3 member B1 isoform X1 n=3 Tax=Mesoplodon densirostris TaxID=48708 RepID=UPI0028DB0DD3|nr:aldehyde dehydrogenase family 3 member B1 isoform X1 [Mesoplodon densirostris]